MVCSRPFTARGSRALRRRASRYRSAALAPAGATSRPAASARSALASRPSRVASPAVGAAERTTGAGAGRRAVDGAYRPTHRSGAARAARPAASSHHFAPRTARARRAVARSAGPPILSTWRRHAASTNSRTRCSETGLCRNRCTEPSVIRAARPAWSSARPATMSTMSGNCACSRPASCPAEEVASAAMSSTTTPARCAMSAAARSISEPAAYTSCAGSATRLRVSRSLRSWVNASSCLPMSVSSGGTPPGGGVAAELCALVWDATAVTI